MRLFLVAVVLVVAVPAIVPPAGAIAVPPVLCDGACTIPGGVLPGFMPPVAVVTSGSAVTWVGSDPVAHINVEGAVIADASSCFEATYAGPFGATVTFRLEGGALLAEVDGRDATCDSAVMLPAGAGAVLGYQCLIHAVTMKGLLVVVP